MVEVLGIFGFLSWLILVSYEWLSSLQVFPAIVSATVLVPIFALRDYRRMQRWFCLQGLSGRRAPGPPERFYWEINRGRIQRANLWSRTVAIAGWSNPGLLPPSCALDSDSLVGCIPTGVDTL